MGDEDVRHVHEHVRAAADVERDAEVADAEEGLVLARERPSIVKCSVWSVRSLFVFTACF
jgi:hypothetical protein